MKRYRIGNTLTVTWSITKTDGSEYELEKTSLTLYASVPGKRIEIPKENFEVSGNTIIWEFNGDSQKLTGPYSLTLVKTINGIVSITLDKCNAFELVPWSCLAGGTDASGISTEASIELESSLDIISDTILSTVQEKIDNLKKNLVGEKSVGGGEIFNDYGNNQAGEKAHAEGTETTADGYGSHAEGNGTESSGISSHAEGNLTKAKGNFSHTEGNNTQTLGIGSHAEGYSFTSPPDDAGTVDALEDAWDSYDGQSEDGHRFSVAGGDYSHIEGEQNFTAAPYSHAEGRQNIVRAPHSHAEGYANDIKESATFGAHAEGQQNIVSAQAAHAEGKGNIISVDAVFSHAEGEDNEITGIAAHAEGNSVVVSGTNSHGEGYNNKINGHNAHGEGENTVVDGRAAHAEGNGAQATGYGAHAEGLNTKSSASYSHAEGSTTEASGDNAHAEGANTVANKPSSHAEGNGAQATGYGAHAEGSNTVSSGQYAHAEGIGNKAMGNGSHAEGNGTIAQSDYSHAEGEGSNTPGTHGAHAEGYKTVASGTYGAHAEGQETESSGQAAHAEGGGSKAKGNFAHAEGRNTEANGVYAHTEGNGTKAGDNSHAEGYFTEANSNTASHAEGYSTIADGIFGAHAEGQETHASGQASHAQGLRSMATYPNSHASGVDAHAAADSAHAMGCNVYAQNCREVVIGQYNEKDSNPSPQYYNASKKAFSIGNGTSDAARSDAFKILGNGTVYADNTTIQPMADYAEMFEWADGNLDEEDRIGYFVAFQGNKIKKATGADEEYILGIISGTAAIIGDAPMRWNDKYLTDEWGRPIYETIQFTEIVLQPKLDDDGNTVYDDDGNPVSEEVEIQKQAYVRKVNPEYNQGQEYIPREQRPEWGVVGLLGKVLVRQDGTLVAGGFCKPNSEGIATTADSGYYVLEVKNGTQARVLVR